MSCISQNRNAVRYLAADNDGCVPRLAPRSSSTATSSPSFTAGHRWPGAGSPVENRVAAGLLLVAAEHSAGTGRGVLAHPMAAGRNVFTRSSRRPVGRGRPGSLPGSTHIRSTCPWNTVAGNDFSVRSTRYPTPLKQRRSDVRRPDCRMTCGAQANQRPCTATGISASWAVTAAMAVDRHRRSRVW